MNWLADFETQYDIQYAKDHPELDNAVPKLGGELAALDKQLSKNDNPNAMGAPKEIKQSKDWLNDFENNYTPSVTKPTLKSIIQESQADTQRNFAPQAMAEGALSMATGLGASAYGGLKGMYDLVSGQGVDTATKDIQQAQQDYTYTPSNEMGNKVVEIVGKPIEIGSKIASDFGRIVGKNIGGEKGANIGEALGSAAVPIAATLFGGAGALKSAKGVQLPQAPNIPIVSSIARGVRDVVRTKSPEGVQALANEFLQKQTTPEEAVKIIESLKDGKEIVPFSPVTSADAIAQANRATYISGNPDRFGGQYVSLQEGMSKLPETSAELVKYKLQQEYARNKILDDGAGTDKSYSSAENIRRANAQRNFAPIIGEKLVSDSELSNLMNRPSMEIASNVASKIAQEEGRKFELAKSTPEQTIEQYNPVTLSKEKVVIPEQFAEYSTESLQDVKLALDKMISKPQDYAITSAEVRAITQTRGKLIDWLSNKSQAYEKANKAYAIDSTPIQQMDLWRLLRDKYQAPTGKESPGVYLRMLRDETKAIKDATGWGKAQAFTEIFDTKQSALANALATEMENNLVKQRMEREIQTPNLGNPTKGIEPTLPNMLMREAMIANFILKHLAQKANVAVNIAASKILADPKMLANTLSQVTKPHRQSILTFIREASMNKNAATLAAAQQQQQQQAK